MEKYKTYIAENVLEDYSSGLIVIKAINKKEAIKKIKQEIGNMWNYYNKNIILNLRLLKNDELVYVYGGG